MGKVLLSDPTRWFPMPVALVSCQKTETVPNIIVIGYVGFSNWDPPTLILGIQKDRYSRNIIAESNEFVVNFPKSGAVAQTDYCGFISGKVVNKFETSGFTPIPATKVSAPLIRECPLNIECRLTQILPLGSHEIFIGEVLATHMDEDVVENGDSFDPLILMSRNYVTISESIAPIGVSVGNPPEIVSEEGSS